MIWWRSQNPRGGCRTKKEEEKEEEENKKEKKKKRRRKRRLLTLSCLFVRLSTWKNSCPTGRIFIKTGT
jgi:hypothetical protein